MSVGGGKVLRCSLSLAALSLVPYVHSVMHPFAHVLCPRGPSSRGCKTGHLCFLLQQGSVPSRESLAIFLHWPRMCHSYFNGMIKSPNPMPAGPFTSPTCNRPVGKRRLGPVFRSLTSFLSLVVLCVSASLHR